MTRRRATGTNPGVPHVGLNLLFLRPNEVGGTETYARELIASLATRPDWRFSVFLSRSAEKWPLPDGVARVVAPFRAESKAIRYVFEQSWLPRAATRAGVQVLHSLGYTSPAFFRGWRVVTIHDANWLRLAAHMSATRRAALSAVVGLGLRRANRILVPSEFTATELRTLLPTCGPRIRVTPYAPSALRNPSVRGSRRSADPYFIAFDSRSSHKNIPSLCRAFLRAKIEHRLPHKLLLVGHSGSGIAQADDDAIARTGFIATSEVDALLAQSSGLIFPSSYEGFGFPLVDAFALGVPVACSTAGSLPEVAQGAALLFDPSDDAAIGRAIVELAENPMLVTDLVRRGTARAKALTWHRTADLTIEAYAESGVGLNRQ